MPAGLGIRRHGAKLTPHGQGVGLRPPKTVNYKPSALHEALKAPSLNLDTATARWSWHTTQRDWAVAKLRHLRV